MRIARPLVAGLLAAFLAFVLVYASGCGTDAVGVDECRDIEYARCEAARYCGLVDNTDKAVDACKRFYRDQCLHGMTSGERPGAPKVKDCIAAINSAALCAKAGKTSMADCSLAKDAGYSAEIAEPCDVIRTPENVVSCDFLASPVQVPEAGSPDVAEAEAAAEDADASDTGSE